MSSRHSSRGVSQSRPLSACLLQAYAISNVVSLSFTIQFFSYHVSSISRSHWTKVCARVNARRSQLEQGVVWRNILGDEVNRSSTFDTKHHQGAVMRFRQARSQAPTQVHRQWLPRRQVRNLGWYIKPGNASNPIPARLKHLQCHLSLESKGAKYPFSKYEFLG